MWDVGEYVYDQHEDGGGVLELAEFFLDEPKLKAMFFWLVGTWEMKMTRLL
jgi:hypothetical protein